MRILAFLTLASVLPIAAQQQPAIPQLPDTVIHDRDIEYSNVGARVAMDIVRPKGLSASDRLPAVLFIHGGGFRAAIAKAI